MLDSCWNFQFICIINFLPIEIEVMKVCLFRNSGSSMLCSWCLPINFLCNTWFFAIILNTGESKTRSFINNCTQYSPRCFGTANYTTINGSLVVLETFLSINSKRHASTSFLKYSSIDFYAFNSKSKPSRWMALKDCNCLL